MKESEDNKINKYNRSDVVNDWKAAIGLQAVDGLQPSEYLYELAGKHIQGEIGIKDIQRELKVYYESKDLRNEDEAKNNEADKVAANIMEILMDNHFSLSADEYRSIHESLFGGVFSHAGMYRLSDLSKREWVLQFNSVEYGRYFDIIPSIEKAMEEEKGYHYSDFSNNNELEHFAEFISRLWKIHPFYEGNTRTAALFAIKYLRSIGIEVKNDIFRQHSWFFRNALARANYSNPALKVNEDASHLYKFFKNLLIGETNNLRNRDILILPPEGWTVKEEKEQIHTDVPISTLNLKSRISNVAVYKHNDTIHSIKCSIDGVEQKGIHLKMKDLMAFYKMKDTLSKEDLQKFLNDLACKYYDVDSTKELNNNCFKR